MCVCVCVCVFVIPREQNGLVGEKSAVSVSALLPSANTDEFAVSKTAFL